MNCGGLRNDHSENPAHLSKEDSMLQQISCIGPWSTRTSQFLPSIWILGGAGRSGCHQYMLIAACQQRLRMPTRTQRAGRTAAAALIAPSSQRRRAGASDD